MAKRSFHSRHPIPGPASSAAQEIKRGEGKARKQDAFVLQMFKDSRRRLTPSEVYWHAGREYERLVPITSVRRAMTNLTKAGFLRMTRERKAGPFGAMEHLWELVPAKEGNQ